MNIKPRRLTMTTSYRDVHGRTRPVRLSEEENAHVLVWLAAGKGQRSWNELMRAAAAHVAKHTGESLGAVNHQDVREVALLMIREPRAMKRHAMFAKAVKS